MAITNVVFNDPMTDVDGTLLTAHTAVTTWVFDRITLNLIISSNTLQMPGYTTGGRSRAHSTDIVANNQRVSGNIFQGSGDADTGVAARYNHLGSAEFGYTGYQVAGRFSVTTARIYRVDNGTQTNIASYVGAEVVDGVKCGVECDGTTIKLLIADVVKTSVVDATYASGSAGVFCWWNRGLDNITAEDDAVSGSSGWGSLLAGSRNRLVLQ